MNFKVSDGIFKAIGGIGLLAVAYDSHNAAKEYSTMHAKNHKAKTLVHHAMSDMKLDSPSIIKSELKSKIFKFHLEENISDFFVSAGEYVKGIASMLVGNVIPLGLAAVTVLTNGTLSKLFGLGLLGYGGIFLLQEGLGIGKPH